MTPDLEPTSRHHRHAAAYVAAQSEAARPAVRSNLRRAATIAAGHPADWRRYPWHRADAASLEAVRNGLAGNYKPATANASLASVRGVLRRAWQHGDLDRADLERRLDALKTVKGGSAPGRALDMGQVARLFGAAADGTPAGVRDAALLALLYGVGLRRAEAAAADLADLDVTGAETWALRVRGKGRRERLVYIGDGARDALAAWLELRGDDEGPLFAPVNKAGRVQGGRGLTGRAIARRVELRSEQARIGRFSPHVLRRTFATRALDQGVDVATVADLMGHASLDTTRRYDRRGEQAKKDAMTAIAVPYAQPGDGK